MEERYIKCPQCQSASGVFIEDDQNMNITCGICNAVVLFEEITREEFDVLNPPEEEQN